LIVKKIKVKKVGHLPFAGESIYILSKTFNCVFVEDIKV